MKKLTTILFVIFGLFIFNSYAQIPERMNYQAIIRDSENNLLVNQNVSIKLSILNESVDGIVLYSETHTIKTNTHGQVNLLIGDGNVISGEFTNINWGTGDKFLKIEFDESGGSTYIPIGVSQLVTVPYSYYSEKTDTAKVAKKLDEDVLYFTETDTLFAVKDRDGNIVFAVYPDGARVYIDESKKGNVGGFAVTGRNPGKAGVVEYNVFQVAPDSTTVYINDLGKGNIGGFAVTGRNPGKGFDNYFNVNGENNPIVIDPARSRVVWFPKKEAFWAGHVWIQHPDSVGISSLAMGYEAIAKGSFSQSLGYQTRARGEFSTAIGYRTQANGPGCFAVGGEERDLTGTATGNFTVASGAASFALGLGATASGIANTAIGLRSSATGDFASTAFGVFTKATGRRATAIGFGSLASAEQSLALGVADTASAYNSVAMGVGSKASGIAAIALGSFVEANTTGSFVIGQLNIPFGTSDLWNTNDPLFVVGNGIFGIPGVLSTAVRSNAFTILKNGNVGVGINNPQRAVHIKDVIRLEPRLTAPLNPSEGDIYFDGIEKKLKVYDGTQWQTVSWGP